MSSLTASLQFRLGGAWLAEHTLQTLGAGLATFDHDARLVQVDDRASRLLGLDPDEPNHLRLDDARWNAHHLDGFRLDATSDPVIMALTLGTSSVADVIRITMSDGGTRWLAVTALPLLGFDGTAQAVLASLVEVTGIVRDRAAVDVAEQLGRSAFDHASKPMCVVDDEHLLVDWNRAFTVAVDRPDFELMASPLDRWLADGAATLERLRAEPDSVVSSVLGDGVDVEIRAWPSREVRGGSMMVEMSPRSVGAAVDARC